MRLHTIDSGYFKLDGGAMFGVVPKSLWNRYQPSDANNLCTWAMRSLLIEDGGRLILIDTGIGDKQDAKFFSHYYLHGEAGLKGSLSAIGYSMDDITDVFLTHLHFDHVGGSIIRENDKLVPAFKNAVYWSNETHWQHAVEPNAREKASFLTENILPIKDSGQLQFVNTSIITDPGKAYQFTVPFADNIDIRIVNGHTRFMMLPQIRFGDRTILYMADLLPCVSHLPIPWVMSYDIEPLLTMAEKEFIFKEAEQKGFILFLEHDPANECCILQQTEKGIREKSVFKLSELVAETN